VSTTPTDTEALPPGNVAVDPRRLRRKLMWRIVPLVFVLYIISYLDRANVAFVEDQLQEDLGFSKRVIGIGMGLFFVGYLLLEIPGALLVEHWSARKWFSRILVTWGLCSMALALVRLPWHFFLVRFLLGLAEAGFFPGLMVYFTHWFPSADRARAFAGLVLAVPLSQALGAWVTQQILVVHWLDLVGWQWVFLLEGLPAVLMGIAVLFLLADRPRQASWLRREEAEWLEQTLQAERQSVAASGVRPANVFRHPAVWLLAMGILATNTGGYALGFWIKDAFQVLLCETRGSGEEALTWIAGFYCCGLAGVWLAGQLSDRSGERKWHCIAGQVLTAVCLAISLVPGQPWSWIFTWLCLTGCFAYFWPPPFWVLPTQVLSASAAAVAIGFINICANVAGIIGPPVVGWMKDASFDVRSCLLFSVATYAAGGGIIAFLRVPTKAVASPR
jgi:MFS transporter, ACS family, tartrate transporter